MGKHETPTLPLYEQDFVVWLDEQAAKLRARAHTELDWDNLAEEIESVSRRERREIEERLEVLISLLLKWEFQPGFRSHSWQSALSEQRSWIDGIIKTSPSLRGYPARILRRAYQAGLCKAVDQTGLKPSQFPSSPPFTARQALNYKFWPGEPFSPAELIRD